MKGTRIKSILRTRKRNQRWLSAKVGISTVSLCGIASGRTIPYVDTAYRIALILGEPIEDIFFPKIKKGIDAGTIKVKDID